jgi:hypothetical protein
MLQKTFCEYVGNNAYFQKQFRFSRSIHFVNKGPDWFENDFLLQKWN